MRSAASEGRPRYPGAHGSRPTYTGTTSHPQPPQNSGRSNNRLRARGEAALELEEVLLHEIPAQPRGRQRIHRREGGYHEGHADLHAQAEPCVARRAPAVCLGRREPAGGKCRVRSCTCGTCAARATPARGPNSARRDGRGRSRRRQNRRKRLKGMQMHPAGKALRRQDATTLCPSSRQRLQMRSAYHHEQQVGFARRGALWTRLS